MCGGDAEKELLRVISIEERRETRGGGRVPGGAEMLLLDIGRNGRGDVREGRVEGESGWKFSFWEESALEGSGLLPSFIEGGRGAGRGIVGIGNSW